MTERKLVETIDVTPTWTEVLPALLSAYENGFPKSRENAIIELQRMALIADTYNAEKKAK